MSIGRLLELAGVAYLPKAKHLIERERQSNNRLFIATDLVIDVLKPGRYQQGRGDFLLAYRTKDLALEHASLYNRSKHAPMLIYEVDSQEFYNRSGDVFQTMFFVVPIRRYPV